MNFPQIEQKILQFWKEKHIFEKSLARGRKKAKYTFVFYEGPPTANGKPGVHHALTRAFKDVILRFRSMMGEYVPRRAGWDTHGLPVEVAVEKKLGFKSKRDIEAFGIEKFNQEAEKSVWEYKAEWEKFTERMGFWIDLENPYVTYDPYYIESLWYIVQQFHKKGLLQEDFRSVPYCFRCGTALSNAELGMPDVYQEVKDPSVYVKFQIINSQFSKQAATTNQRKTQEYLLAWTTTPWTLPANVALAVHPELEYKKYKLKTRDQRPETRIPDEYIWSANPLPEHPDAEIVGRKLGRELVGLSYEPLYPLHGVEMKGAYRVYAADFVSAEEGTGVVHIAPAFGEDDLVLGRKHNLPVVQILNDEGRFADPVVYQEGRGQREAGEHELFKKARGLFLKKTDSLIVQDLQGRALLYVGGLALYPHQYPHCWRCKSLLIYWAQRTWVVKTSKLKNQLLANNEKINWTPPFMGAGRFGDWLREGKDWNFSRSRYWGTPLPVWRCRSCQKIKVVGSLKELATAQKPRNNYYLMRHGESRLNKKGLVSSHPEKFFNPLTRHGVAEVQKIARALSYKNIGVIVCSPLLRAKQTAEIVKETIGTQNTKRKTQSVEIKVDERLREVDFGVLNGASVRKFWDAVGDQQTKYWKSPEGGESLNEVRLRMMRVILGCEKEYEGKNILLVSHGDPLWVLGGEMQGMSAEATVADATLDLKTGRVRHVPYAVLPRNAEGELDIHRPYVDEVKLSCDCGGVSDRVPEVIDVWFDSGAMPFAQAHWPFVQRQKSRVKSQKIRAEDQRLTFPADYICEALDQTRGWFYTLHVVSTILKNAAAFRNVIVLNLVLDKHGKKMSKSIGNVVDPMAMCEKYGSDALRWYFFTINQPYEPKRFDEEQLKKVAHGFFNLLFNVLNFYKLYRTPGLKLPDSRKSGTVLDRWLSVRLVKTHERVIQHIAAYEVMEPARLLSELLDDASRWWLRRSRRRFQKPASKSELAAGLLVFQDFLFSFAQLLAPFAPFAAEHIFQEIKDDLRRRPSLKDLPESIHLVLFGKSKKRSTKDELLLREMATMRHVASEVLRLRKEVGIKVRQPLQTLWVSAQCDKGLLQLLADEVNVEEVKRGEPPGKVKSNPKAASASEIPFPLWLDLRVTPQLKEKGIVKEMIRQIQDLRQGAGLKPREKVALAFETPFNLKEIISENKQSILFEVGATSLNWGRPKLFSAEKEFEFEGFGKIRMFLKGAMKGKG